LNGGASLSVSSRADHLVHAQCVGPQRFVAEGVESEDIFACAIWACSSEFEWPPPQAPSSAAAEPMALISIAWREGLFDGLACLSACPCRWSGEPRYDRRPGTSVCQRTVGRTLHTIGPRLAWSARAGRARRAGPTATPRRSASQTRPHAATRSSDGACAARTKWLSAQTRQVTGVGDWHWQGGS
jgi:hypothetical protein